MILTILNPRPKLLPKLLNHLMSKFGRHLYTRDALFISGSFASVTVFAHSLYSLKYIVPGIRS